MFVLMATGFIFFRKKMITIQGSADMGKILLYLVIPVVIVNSFWVDRSSERTLALVHSTIIAAIAMGIAITVSMVVFVLKKRCFMLLVGFFKRWLHWYPAGTGGSWQ